MNLLRNGLFLVPVMAMALSLGGPSFALEVGDAAPCVVLDGVDAKGNPTTGCIRDAVSGSHKYTIIDFFSIQCGTCKKNLPLVSQLAADVSRDATLRYVSVDRNAADVKTFIEENKANMAVPVAFDVDRDAKTAYEVVKTPTMFILQNLGSGDYKIVYKHSGALTAADLSHIKELVSH